MVMVANVTYRGSLKAKLIAPKVPLPFKDIEGLANYDGDDMTPVLALGSFLGGNTEVKGDLCMLVYDICIYLYIIILSFSH